MRTNNPTIFDLVMTMNAKDKKKLLNALRNSELTPCEEKGHNYKPGRMTSHLFAPPSVQYVCTRCGHSFTA